MSEFVARRSNEVLLELLTSELGLNVSYNADTGMDIPFYLVIHNHVNESLSIRLDLELGTPLPWPLVEIYKQIDDITRAKYGDILLNTEHVLINMTNEETLDLLVDIAQRANDFLMGYIRAQGTRMTSLELYFDLDGNLVQVQPHGSSIMTQVEQIPGETTSPIEQVPQI